MNKKSNKPTFGTKCPHCGAINQVTGMECLQCGKKVTSVNAVLAWVLIILALLAGFGLFDIFQHFVP